MEVSGTKSVWVSLEIWLKSLKVCWLEQIAALFSTAHIWSSAFYHFKFGFDDRDQGLLALGREATLVPQKTSRKKLYLDVRNDWWRYYIQKKLGSGPNSFCWDGIWPHRRCPFWVQMLSQDAFYRSPRLLRHWKVIDLIAQIKVSNSIMMGYDKNVLYRSKKYQRT